MSLICITIYAAGYGYIDALESLEYGYTLRKFDKLLLLTRVEETTL